MGLFSSIGKAFKSITNVGGDILSSVAGPAVSGLFGAAGAANQNEANLASAQDAREYNRKEAVKLRQWSSRERNAAQLFNKKEAGKSRDFVEEMSSTAHEREVADLRKAGLNPILSAKYGGSSTPPGASASSSAGSGGSASTQAVHMEDTLKAAQSSAQSAFRNLTEMKRTRQDTKNLGEVEKEIRARTTELQQSATNKSANTNVQQQMAEKIRLEGLKVRQETENLKLDKQSKAQQIEGMRETLKRMHNQGIVEDTTFGKIMRYLDRLAPFISSAKSVSGGFR